MTSLLTDLSERAKLRAGASDLRKRSRMFSKGPSADLGVNGKMLGSEKASSNNKLFPPKYFGC